MTQNKAKVIDTPGADTARQGERKAKMLFLFLGGVFIANALLAELIGVKIFSLEATLGLAGAQLPLPGSEIPLDFNLTAGVLIWPFVFIGTDIINEYYGKRGVRMLSYLTAGLISYAFVVIYLAIRLHPAEFWVELNNQSSFGGFFDINFAFARIFGQGLGIIVGSLVAFLVGQLLDVFIFHKLRRITGEKNLWLRATGSTLISQLIDSFVVLFIAFYWLSSAELSWPLGQLFSVASLNYLYKFVVAISLTPLIYASHWFIDRYLGKALSNQMKVRAMEGSTRFF